jgi:hypothetical protein
MEGGNHKPSSLGANRERERMRLSKEIVGLLKSTVETAGKKLPAPYLFPILFAVIGTGAAYLLGLDPTWTLVLLFVLAIGGMGLGYLLQHPRAAEPEYGDAHLQPRAYGDDSSASEKTRTSAVPEPSLEVLRESYLALMAEEWGTLRLVGVDPNASDPRRASMSLEQVYIHLDATTPRPDHLRAVGKDREVRFLSQEKPLSAVEAVWHAPQGRAVLLGQPGSGKSTFLRNLALRMASACQQPSAYDLHGHLPVWQGPAGYRH